MTLIRIILFVAATALVIIIYSLPRVVVEDKEEKVELSEPIQLEDEHSSIDRIIPDSLQSTVKSLKELFENSDSNEKRIIFADSLAKTFREVLFFDSAAYFLGKVADQINTPERNEIAGDAYFDAFNFAVSETNRGNFSEKARSYYQKVLDEQPGNLDVKANVAVTYVTSQAPMQGINMLREILDEEPTHERALFNLGLLSITSSQFDIAVERFSVLLDNYPDNHEARLYLGYCFVQLGQIDDARMEFQKLLESNASNDLKEAARNYLESIN